MINSKLTDSVEWKVQDFAEKYDLGFKVLGETGHQGKQCFCLSLFYNANPDISFTIGIQSDLFMLGRHMSELNNQLDRAVVGLIESALKASAKRSDGHSSVAQASAPKSAGKSGLPAQAAKAR